MKKLSLLLRHRRWRLLSLLFLIWCVLYIGRLGEAQLKYDSLLYGALAKHMLSTGDWAVPHYSLTDKANWFPHPPGVLWMQAAFFKAFGVSTVTARLLPSLFALATVFATFYWGTLLGGDWLGFCSGFILLTSSRYIKYASDLILDGPFTFFVVMGALCFLLATREKRSRLWTLGLGVFGAAAFLSKGIVSFSLFAATALYALAIDGQRKRLSASLSWLLGLATSAALVSLWLFLGNGWDYLHHYWAESVAYRLGAESFSAHFKPFVNLAVTYQPWLGFLIAGLILAVRRLLRRDLAGEVVLPVLFVVIILAGFSYSGHFLEHYLVPLYPFAALLSALPFEKLSRRARTISQRVIYGLTLLALILLATWPGRIRTLRDEPIRQAAEAAAKTCPASSLDQVLFTEALGEHWFGLAAVLWETPWDAKWVTAPPEPSGRQILLVNPSETPGTAWERIERGAHDPFAMYRPRGTAVCR